MLMFRLFVLNITYFYSMKIIYRVCRNVALGKNGLTNFELISNTVNTSLQNPIFIYSSYF